MFEVSQVSVFIRSRMILGDVAWLVIERGKIDSARYCSWRTELLKLKTLANAGLVMLATWDCAAPGPSLHLNLKDFSSGAF